MARWYWRLEALFIGDYVVDFEWSSLVRGLLCVFVYRPIILIVNSSLIYQCDFHSYCTVMLTPARMVERHAAAGPRMYGILTTKVKK